MKPNKKSKPYKAGVENKTHVSRINFIRYFSCMPVIDAFTDITEKASQLFSCHKVACDDCDKHKAIYYKAEMPFFRCNTGYVHYTD